MIEDLTVEDCFQRQSASRILQGLRHNRSLKKLRVRLPHRPAHVNADHLVPPEALQAIPQWLQENHTIQSLELSHIHLPPQTLLQLVDTAVGNGSLRKIVFELNVIHGVGAEEALAV